MAALADTIIYKLRPVNFIFLIIFCY